jgi:hypothetical protein
MKLLAPVLSVCFALSALGQIIEEPYAFTTLAGAPLYAARDGIGTEARFKRFISLAADKDGNIYAVDESGLRKVTPEKVVTTMVRGSFLDVAVNRSGEVFVSSNPSGSIFRVTPIGTLITRSDLPSGKQITFDRSDNLYVLTSNAVVKVSKDGVASMAASLENVPPWSDYQLADIAVDSQGDVYLAYANFSGPAIYKSTASGSFEQWVSFPGPIPSLPTALATDNTGNVYVLDGGRQSVRKIASDKTTTILPGFYWTKPYGAPLNPWFQPNFFTGPYTIAVDDSGNIIVGGLDTILYRAKVSEVMSAFAGTAGGPSDMDATGQVARFGGWTFSAELGSFYGVGLESVATDASGTIYAADPRNSSIRKVTGNGEVSTLAKGFGPAQEHDQAPVSVTVDPQKNVYVAFFSAVSLITPEGKVKVIAGSTNEFGYADGFGEQARFANRSPFFLFSIGLLAITGDNSGKLYVFDGGNNFLRRLTPTPIKWIVSTVTNLVDENGTPISLSGVSGLAADATGNLFATEASAVLKLAPSDPNWIVTTVAGSRIERGYKDGPAKDARFGRLQGLALDSHGNILVSDWISVRKISSSGYVTTIAGGQAQGSSDGIGGSASFYDARGIAVDPSGDIYIADYGNFTLRKGFLPPRIKGSGYGMENGTFHFSATGPTQTKTIIQTSTNLIEWVSVSTNSVGGDIDFGDSQSPPSSRRFYRTLFP